MTARAFGVPAVVLALAVLGCGRGGATTLPETLPAEAARAGPALCAPLGSRVTGRVRTPAATELSGLVLSRTQPGVLWTHNDSGDGARLLALRRSEREGFAYRVTLPRSEAARRALEVCRVADLLVPRPGTAPAPTPRLSA